MKFQLTLFFLLFGVLTSCKKEIPLVFSSESFTEDTLDMCKNIGCPEITINYVEALGEEAVSEKINSEIRTFIITALNIGDDSIPKAKTIAEAASYFIKTYRMHSAEFPDMSAEYIAELYVSESYLSKEVLSLQFKQYLYAGGAHGNGTTTFMNFDSRTGIKIPSEALFKNIKNFTVFAEKKFKEAQEISRNSSINSTGFWFKDDVFYLPETIGFTENALVLIYNQYEISSYSQGPIELEILMAEALPFLSVK